MYAWSLFSTCGYGDVVREGSKINFEDHRPIGRKERSKTNLVQYMHTEGGRWVSVFFSFFCSALYLAAKVNQSIDQSTSHDGESGGP